MTNQLTRRRFLSTGAAVASSAVVPAAGLAAGANTPAEPPQRKFYPILSVGRLGFEANFNQSLELAVKHGFEGLDPDPNYFASLGEGGLKRLLDDLQAKNLKFGAAGLPVEFRKDEATFSEGLKKLPATADILQKAGIWHVSTWVLPCSNELTYLQNFRQHADRLRQCANILSNHGQKLGLEYVAPRTFWRSERHPFAHTLSETKELEVAIGTNNLGIQLDSWHWFNAQETAKDLVTLRGSDVLTVDLNDAPRGLTLDQYQDDHRELPAATGVIPVAEFLGALVQIGYDGPIQAEPFNAALRAMPLDQACASASAAIKKAFSVAHV
ncbi:MAG TPA: TIM barrel protein [Terriglobia bacterium]|nr:TIM barrel protein [Terriglobia bacterium]